ncbi:hypothetical protein ACHAXT_006728 [Thalassiosira profunda]
MNGSEVANAVSLTYDAAPAVLLAMYLTSGAFILGVGSCSKSTMSRRYYYHSELEHHKDQPWVISKKDGLCVDLKSGVDPTEDDPKEWRSERGSKLWSDCGAAARMKIMEAFVEHLKAKRKKKRRKEVNQGYYARNNSKEGGDEKKRDEARKEEEKERLDELENKQANLDANFKGIKNVLMETAKSGAAAAKESQEADARLRKQLAEAANESKEADARIQKRQEDFQKKLEESEEKHAENSRRLERHDTEIAELNETQLAHGKTLSAHGKMLLEHSKKLAKSNRRQTFATNEMRATHLLDAGAPALAYIVLSRYDLEDPCYMPTLTRYLEGYLERLEGNSNLQLYVFLNKEHLGLSSLHVFHMVECEVLPISYVAKTDGDEKTAPKGQFAVKEFSPLKSVDWEWANVRGMQLLKSFPGDGTEIITLPVTKPSVLEKRGTVKVNYEHEHEGATTSFPVEAAFNANGRDVANKYVDDRSVVLGLGDDKATRESIRLLVLDAQRTFLGEVLVEHNGVQIWAKDKANVEYHIRTSDDLAPADAVPICALVEEELTRREAACLESIEAEKAFFEKHVQEVAEDNHVDVEHVRECLEEMEVFKVYPEGVLDADGEKIVDFIPSYGWVYDIFY